MITYSSYLGSKNVWTVQILDIDAFSLIRKMKLTGLTARQIRYYESLYLVVPERLPETIGFFP